MLIKLQQSRRRTDSIYKKLTSRTLIGKESLGISLIDVGWLAGILEGEGCFYAPPGKYSHHIRVTVRMTDRDTIQRIHKILKFGWLSNPIRRERYKDIFEWYCFGTDAAAVMMMVFPLMSERRRTKIRECLEDWRDGSHRVSLSRQTREEIKRLYPSQPQRAIAKKFGISQQQVSKIVRSKND